MNKLEDTDSVSSSNKNLEAPSATNSLDQTVEPRVQTFLAYLDFLTNASGHYDQGNISDSDGFISSEDEEEVANSSSQGDKQCYDKTYLYRKEYNGVVIYDKTARLIG